jgi:hypothetical protein
MRRAVIFISGGCVFFGIRQVRISADVGKTAADAGEIPVLA